MRYLLYILIFILFSCDSIDELGVEEYQSSFNYYDFIAYAWASFLQEDYDLSIAYFNEALLIDDVDQNGVSDFKHHSAYVGISWANTYKLNTMLSSYGSEVETLRDNAISYLCYYQDDQGWHSGNCEDDIALINASDALASDFYNIDLNPTGIIFCEQDYCCHDCFKKDKDVALIYYFAYKYYLLFNDNDPNYSIYYSTAITKGLDFLSSTQVPDNLDKNTEYNFMNGKSLETPIFNLSQNNIIILLAQLYLKNADYQNAATILNASQLCTVNSNDVESIIDCVESF